MRLGLYIAPQTNGADEDVDNIEAVVDQAVQADEAGFSTIYLTEHHLDDYNTYCDPHLLGAYLAGKLRAGVARDQRLAGNAPPPTTHR